MAELPLWAEYVSALGAGLGAFAAGAAAVYAARAARASQTAAEATTIAAEATADVARVERERWDAEQEASRHARVTVRFELDRGDSSSSRREFLVIENHGPAVASDVDLRGDAVLMGTIHFGADRLPLAALHPGGTHRLHLAVVAGQPVYFTPHVRWTDPAGPHDEIFPVTLV